MFYIYPLVFPRGQTYAFAAEKAVNRNPFKTNRDHFFFVLPHVRESSTVLDSGFHDVDSTGIPVIFSGSCILDSNLKWDSGFLQLHVFRIPQAQFPGFRNLGLPYMWRFVKLVSMFLSTHSSVTKHNKIIENCLNLFQPRDDDLHYAI